MKLELQSAEGQLIKELNNDNFTIAEFDVRARQIIHVVNTDPDAEQLTGADVPKFELTKKEYEERPDTVLGYKKRNQMGRFAPDYESKMSDIKQKEAEEAAHITVGSRCEVRIDNGAARRGTVRFVGETSFEEGIWAGIEYDEPYGKNDGSVEGKRYFTCEPKYGGFVKCKWVVCGEYPELGLSDDEEL
ncbi:hypothetical protein SARC_05238 [Sphaeroforma arctica JP610]|uniref:CAP-Gly domain-containing protein n=1 Tax=Sphaeroforma arctica JP610 TaxID=667725 RepID=A0A0L0G0Y1_9EUKA|nr:hypothetical protein SARC_05238 [Sphaeroforma arctica JP610]KNC82486.1 hypothetical protein SARC_05238 [Sphaeroforma arctica JP610]|eukprot:XP_014156388.1 hypothetical protein SARC_05238 [Sphaeroforma arctica JP610]